MPDHWIYTKTPRCSLQFFKIIFIQFLDRSSVFTCLIAQVDYQENEVLFTSYGDDGMNVNIFLIFPTNNILKLLTHDIIL